MHSKLKKVRTRTFNRTVLNGKEIFKKIRKTNIFFMDFLSAGEVAVRMRKKRLGAGMDNNDTKMGCAVIA